MTSIDLSGCRWPPLPAPYAEALEEAVRFALAEYQPSGIVAAGSVARGEADAGSNLNLLVIHAAAYWQRLQRRYASVPVEILVQPPAGVRGCFATEHRRARPAMAHMLTTGAVVLDGPELAALREEAALWLARRSAPTADEDIWACYEVATTLEDADDVRTRDPAMAASLVSEAVTAGLRHWLHVRDGVLPARKELLARVRAADAELGQLAEEFYRAAELEARLKVGRQIAQRCVGATGFFEWDSARVPVPGRRHPDSPPTPPDVDLDELAPITPA